MNDLIDEEFGMIPPDLQGWHQHGIDIHATHMIATFEEGEDYLPVYVMPDGDSLERVEHQCYGGGHVHAIYDLSKLLTEAEVTDFYKCVCYEKK